MTGRYGLQSAARGIGRNGLDAPLALPGASRPVSSKPNPLTNTIDSLQRLRSVCDAWGCRWFGYDNLGRLISVSNAFGPEQLTTYDLEDRPLSVTDANNVTITNSYDELGWLRTRTAPDGGVEAFGYSARGLISPTNQLTNLTSYVYDEAGRKPSKWSSIRTPMNSATTLQVTWRT